MMRAAIRRCLRIEHYSGLDQSTVGGGEVDLFTTKASQQTLKIIKSDEKDMIAREVLMIEH
jgi:hypothetical protein